MNDIVAKVASREATMVLIVPKPEQPQGKQRSARDNAAYMQARQSAERHRKMERALQREENRLKNAEEYTREVTMVNHARGFFIVGNDTYISMGIAKVTPIVGDLVTVLRIRMHNHRFTFRALEITGHPLQETIEFIGEITRVMGNVAFAQTTSGNVYIPAKVMDFSTYRPGTQISGQMIAVTGQPNPFRATHAKPVA